MGAVTCAKNMAGKHRGSNLALPSALNTIPLTRLSADMALTALLNPVAATYRTWRTPCRCASDILTYLSNLRRDGATATRVAQACAIVDSVGIAT